jgi:hypothetical protein
MSVRKAQNDKSELISELLEKEKQLFEKISNLYNFTKSA